MQHLPQKLHLAKTIFFKKVGKEVYVKNVSSGEEFIFTSEAMPIFSALRRGATQRKAILQENATFLREIASYGLLDVGGISRKNKPKVVNEYLQDNTCVTNSNISGHFQEVCRSKLRLWHAGLELTYRCNAHCRHCYLDIPKEQSNTMELTEREWLSVVDQLSRMGCMNVLVTGGEPTLHSSFITICKHIIKRGMLCDIYTNGLAIPDDLFKALCKLPLNSISVSLYSGTDTFHDTITGVTGSFKKTLASLLRFKEAGLDAYAKVPVFHKHLDDFYSAKELGHKFGFRVVASNILVPGHSGKTRNPMMMDSCEYREFLEQETMPDSTLENSISHQKLLLEPLCYAGQTTLCVSPFGEVMPCNSFPTIGCNVRQMPLAKIWKESEIFMYLRKTSRCDVSPDCSVCKNIAYCTVCPGASWIENKGHLAPSSWSCEQARVRAAFNRQIQNNKE